MRTQKPTTVVVTLKVPLVVPANMADVVQQEATLREDLRKSLQKATFPLSHARVEGVEINSVPIAAGEEEV